MAVEASARDHAIGRKPLLSVRVVDPVFADRSLNSGRGVFRFQLADFTRSASADLRHSPALNAFTVYPTHNGRNIGDGRTESESKSV